MSLTETTKVKLGFKAPNFTLPDTNFGKPTSLVDVKGTQGTVVMFICNHCPYVVHVLDEILNIANDYQSQGIGFVAISANDVENYPDDHPDKMNELAKQKQFPFPYLYDETQETAKAYDAACTPDFSVFDADLKCVYRGRMDNATPGNQQPVTGKDLRLTLDHLLDGTAITEVQYPSMGCNIKWKK